MDWLIKLLSRLFGGQRAPVEPPKPEEPVSGDPEWLRIARKDLGLREVAGPASNPEIMRYWSACDYDPPEGDETAWCSAAANNWMQKAGQPGTRQPNARSWERWGAELKTPKLGCIVVFWRGSPTSWQGHVALYIGPGDKPGHIKVLGGNQGNSVSIAEYPASQVIGYRWPTTGANSRTLKAQTAGMVLGDGMTAAGFVGANLSQPGILESLPDALAIGTGLQSLATYWPWFAVLGITVSILARMVTIWARVSDWQKKAV
jgi:uncharacterized protein (TIGR02594 family)